MKWWKENSIERDWIDEGHISLHRNSTKFQLILLNNMRMGYPFQSGFDLKLDKKTK